MDTSVRTRITSGFHQKGHTNMIRIDREGYLIHTVIDLEAFNEPSQHISPC
jgi:hypothetical protein